MQEFCEQIVSSTKDLSIDSNDMLNKFIARVLAYLNSHFKTYGTAAEKVHVLATLYKSGLKDLADYVISNEEEVNRHYKYSQVEKIVTSRFEQTKLR